MAKRAEIKLEVDSRSSIRSLRSLNDEMEQLKAQIEETTDPREFRRLASEISNIESEVKNAELAMEGLDAEQMASEWGAVITGVADAFAGAAIIFGATEEESNALNENIQKGIGIAIAARGAVEGYLAAQKLLRNSTIATRIATTAYTAAQSALNFVVLAGSNALRIFRLALIATGIGAIVVLIGSLIANFDTLKDIILDVVGTALQPFIWAYQKIRELITGVSQEEREAQESAKERQQEINNELQKTIDLMDRRLEAAEEFRNEVDRANQLRIQKLKALGASQEEIDEAEKKRIRDRIRLLNEENEERVETSREAYLAVQEQIFQAQTNLGSLNSFTLSEIAKTLDETGLLSSEMINQTAFASDRIGELIEQTTDEEEKAALQRVQFTIAQLNNQVDSYKDAQQEINFINEEFTILNLEQQRERREREQEEEEKLQKQREKWAKARVAALRRIRDIEENAEFTRLANLEKIVEQERDAIEKSVENAEELTDGQIKQLEKLRDEQEKILKQREQAVIEAKQREVEVEIENLQEREDLSRQVKADIEQALRDDLEKELEAVRIEFKGKLQAAADDTKAAIQDIQDKRQELREKEIQREDEQFNLLNELTLSQRELEIQQLVQEYDKKFELARNNAELEAELQRSLNERIAQINEEYRQSEKEKREADLQNWANLQQAKLDQVGFFAQGAANLTSSLFQITNNLGDQSVEAQKRRQRRQFNIQKAVDAAQAGINTASAIVKAIALFGPPPSPLGIAGIATAGAIGAAQIAAILSKQFPDEGGGSSAGAGSISIPSGSSGGTTQTAPTPDTETLFGTAGLRGITSGESEQQAGIRQGGSGGTVRAYVVSSDITNEQQLESEIKRKAQIG